MASSARTPDPGQVVQFVHAVDALRRLSWPPKRQRAEADRPLRRAFRLRSFKGMLEQLGADQPAPPEGATGHRQSQGGRRGLTSAATATALPGTATPPGEGRHRFQGVGQAPQPPKLTSTHWVQGQLV